MLVSNVCRTRMTTSCPDLNLEHQDVLDHTLCQGLLLARLQSMSDYHVRLEYRWLVVESPSTFRNVERRNHHFELVVLIELKRMAEKSWLVWHIEGALAIHGVPRYIQLLLVMTEYYAILVCTSEKHNI